MGAVKVASLPPREYLNYRFIYNPNDGCLLRRFSGRSACAIHSGGYYTVSCEGRQFLAHRVIWKMVTGEDPDQIDHIDGDRKNNKWVNLRDATNQENRWNTRLIRTNTSGFKGVSLCKDTGLWKATIKAEGKWVWLGRYPTREEAHKAYREEAIRLHGEFANDGGGRIA